MLVRVYGGCSSRSRDSIKSLRIAQLHYTAKAALIALERVFVHCSRVILKSKEERIRHLF